MSAYPSTPMNMSAINAIPQLFFVCQHVIYFVSSLEQIRKCPFFTLTQLHHEKFCTVPIEAFNLASLKFFRNKGNLRLIAKIATICLFFVPPIG